MDKRTDQVISFLVILIVLTMPGCSHQPHPIADPDQEVIDQLAKVHSDLRQPHSLDFYLYLPTKAKAASAAFQLCEHGYNSVVKRDADGKNWLCLATKNIIPDKLRIHEAQERMRALAAKHGGEYDGWESEVKR